ncbi:MAG: PH domain-containing protein [Nitrososphaerota archaeon]|nr:PH domain-containing protein [Nitrososphaerota archaeon]
MQVRLDNWFMRNLSVIKAVLRVVFGAFWLVDGILKFQPGLVDAFPDMVRSAAAGQPQWLSGWFSFWAGEGVLRIRRSLASTTAVTILLQNVTRVRVDVPFFMRPFHVGTVWAHTCDSRAHPLFNLKDPLALAEKIRPKCHFEGVFRPTVG